jgi:hypothetical protein
MTDDDDDAAIARAFAAEQRGKRSRRRRRRSPTPKRTRAWWSSAVRTPAGGVAVPQTATPAPSPETKEPQSLSLAEWLAAQ